METTRTSDSANSYYEVFLIRPLLKPTVPILPSKDHLHSSIHSPAQRKYPEFEDFVILTIFFVIFVGARVRNEEGHLKVSNLLFIE